MKCVCFCSTNVFPSCCNSPVKAVFFFITTCTKPGTSTNGLAGLIAPRSAVNLPPARAAKWDHIPAARLQSLLEKPETREVKAFPATACWQNLWPCSVSGIDDVLYLF